MQSTRAFNSWEQKFQQAGVKLSDSGKMVTIREAYRLLLSKTRGIPAVIKCTLKWLGINPSWYRNHFRIGWSETVVEVSGICLLCQGFVWLKIKRIVPVCCGLGPWLTTRLDIIPESLVEARHELTQNGGVIWVSGLKQICPWKITMRKQLVMLGSVLL